MISATIAEMDFPLADPIVEVLHAAMGRHDLGYTPGDTTRLAKAFEGFAARRLNWTIDPGQVIVVTDVMIGMLELARRRTGWISRIRIPASFCGVYGLRPSVGVVPLTGFQPPGRPARSGERSELHIGGGTVGAYVG